MTMFLKAFLDKVYWNILKLYFFHIMKIFVGTNKFFLRNLNYFAMLYFGIGQE